MRSIRTRRDAVALGVVAALALALPLAGTACSNDLPPPMSGPTPPGGPPRRGGILTTASFGDIRAIDPANVADGIVPQILENIFAGLVDYDADGKLQPDLAESWTVEDGGKTYRFVLRQGVHFQDGEEVTADDVKRSAERALHPSAPNAYRSYFASIQGFDELTAKKTDHLSGIVVEGRYVVSFHLKEPDATFLPVLATEILRPVCKSGGTRYSDTWHACGAGPFKLPPNGWDRGRSVTLERFDGYFRPGLPYLDGFRFLLHESPLPQRFKLEHGELDVMRDFLMPDALRLQADRRWSPLGAFEADKQISGEAMNTEMPPFDNVEIRRAVAAAIDRDELVMIRASNLRAANQPIPPAVFGYDPSLRGQKYDYQAALEHMRKAGYPYDPVTKTGGWPGVIPYTVYAQGLNAYTGQIIQQQLAKIGIRIELRIVNYASYLAIRGRRKQSPFGPSIWEQDYPDGMSFLEPLFETKSINDEESNNWSFYSNPRYDEIVERARRELDDAKRKKLYAEASQIVCDDAPWAFTVNYRWYVIRQGYVRDWRPHPLYTYDLRRVWLDRPPGSGGSAGGARSGAAGAGAGAWLPRDARSAIASLLGLAPAGAGRSALR
jgi:ABC-type transport system substrate-binding protein